MNKFFLGLVVLALAPSQAYADVANDVGFRQVIAKQVIRESAQHDIQEALKVVRAVRLEQKLARKKKGR